MWIEAEDGSLVNLDFKRSIVAEDRVGGPGDRAAICVVAIGAGEAEGGSVVLREFAVHAGQTEAQARSAAAVFLHAVRQAMADRSVLIRPVARAGGAAADHGLASKRGELAEVLG